MWWSLEPVFLTWAWSGFTFLLRVLFSKSASKIEMGVAEICAWKSHSLSIAAFWLLVEKGIRRTGKVLVVFFWCLLSTHPTLLCVLLFQWWSNHNRNWPLHFQHLPESSGEGWFHEDSQWSERCWGPDVSNMGKRRGEFYRIQFVLLNSLAKIWLISGPKCHKPS